MKRSTIWEIVFAIVAGVIFVVFVSCGSATEPEAVSEEITVTFFPSTGTHVVYYPGEKPCWIAGFWDKNMHMDLAVILCTPGGNGPNETSG